MEKQVLQTLKAAIVDGDETQSALQAREALLGGIDPHNIVTLAITPGIQRTGQLWQSGEYFLPEVIMSAEAFKAAMRVVEPHLRARSGDAIAKRYVIGSVKGDVHDLGKNIVCAMLEATGFEVLDLGVNVPTEVFVSKAREVNADIVGVAAYMSTTMLEIKHVITALREAGLRERIKIMVGGVPITQAFADEVGADAWGKDALDAVDKAKALCGSEIR